MPLTQIADISAFRGPKIRQKRFLLLPIFTFLFNGHSFILTTCVLKILFHVHEVLKCMAYIHLFLFGFRTSFVSPSPVVIEAILFHLPYKPQRLTCPYGLITRWLHSDVLAHAEWKGHELRMFRTSSHHALISDKWPQLILSRFWLNEQADIWCVASDARSLAMEFFHQKFSVSSNGLNELDLILWVPHRVSHFLTMIYTKETHQNQAEM